MAIDYNLVTGLIRAKLLNESAIAAITSLRIYSRELALVLQPQFPCIAFSLSGGEPTDFVLKQVLEEPTMIMWYYNDHMEGYNEIFALYKSVFEVLHNKAIKDDPLTTTIVSRQLTMPEESYDPTAEVNFLTNSWRVTILLN